MIYAHTSHSMLYVPLYRSLGEERGEDTSIEIPTVVLILVLSEKDLTASGE